jgi:hypothetical protein
MGWRDYKNHQMGIINHASHDQVFDVAQWDKTIDRLVEDIVLHDPHGSCWDWIVVHRLDTWKLFLTTLREVDAAFENRNSETLHGNIMTARRLYHECVAAWKNRTEQDEI